MEKEISIYDTQVMNYSPTYQSDYAPQLPDPHFSSVHSLRQHQIDKTGY